MRRVKAKRRHCFEEEEWGAQGRMPRACMHVCALPVACGGDRQGLKRVGVNEEDTCVLVLVSIRESLLMRNTMTDCAWGQAGAAEGERAKPGMVGGLGDDWQGEEMEKQWAEWQEKCKHRTH